MARRKTQPGHLERLRVLLDSGVGRPLVRLTLVALVFLLAGVVMRQARAYTYRLDEFRLHRESMRFTELPDWADAGIQWALQPRNFRPFSVSIYDAEAEATVRGHVQRSPFIRSVRSVRVLYPNRVEVVPILRRPVGQVAAWVDGPGRKQVRRWRLLTADGTLLPRAPYRTYLERLPFALPTVTGITEPMPRSPGEVWEDRSGRVAEAVAAAQLAGRIFRDLGGRAFVARVDVSRFYESGADDADCGEVRLVLSFPPRRTGGARIERTIEWGRTERAATDVSWTVPGYAKKMETLVEALREPSPPGYLDVRG